MYVLSSGKVWYWALQGLLGISETTCLVYNKVVEILAAWGEVFLPCSAVPKWWKRRRLFYVYQIAAFLLPHFLLMYCYCSCNRKNPAQHTWGKGTNLVFPLVVLLHVAKSGLRYQHQWHRSLI